MERGRCWLEPQDGSAPIHLAEHDVVLVANGAGHSLADLSAVAGVQARMDGGRVLISTREGVRTTQLLTTWALERGVELEHFQVMQPSLEDVYLELTQ